MGKSSGGEDGRLSWFRVSGNEGSLFRVLIRRIMAVWRFVLPPSLLFGDLFGVWGSGALGFGHKYLFLGLRIRA